MTDPRADNILTRIASYKREEVARRRLQPALASTGGEEFAPTHVPRGFRAALRRAATASRPALIAEIKKASPSRGVIREDFRPDGLARGYAAGGAACLSVLTDGPSFLGSNDDLVVARAACALPVLRKDFLVDPWQVEESRRLGADAVLVILAMIDDRVAEAITAAAQESGMDVLVEVHDEAELERAAGLATGLIGINSRDLRSFDVDLAVFERLARSAPSGALLVAESGIASPQDVERVARSGAEAVLVGESLMRHPDVAEAARRLLGARSTTRD